MTHRKKIEISITIDRNKPEIIETTKAVSDYLYDLPLSREQYDKLLGLLTAQVSAIEKNGFMQGLASGIEGVKVMI